MTYDKNEHSYHLTHDDIIPLIRELPGRNMIHNIANAIKPWVGESNASDVYFYTSHGEFTLGKCGNNGKVGRIDSIIQILPPDFHVTNKKYCNLGIEIKCSSSDLMKDTKLVDKYLCSGLCDYYFLVTTTDELALMASCKYQDNDSIGVASLASGIVFKTPKRQYVSIDNKAEFVRLLANRKHHKASPYLKYYLQDDDYMIIRPNAITQNAPIVKIMQC